MRGTTVQKNCLACGDIITVRLADHKRGWGKFCDKACSAAFKCGMRPKDVNRRHAKLSFWADCMMTERDRCYDGGEPPKAPSIEQQIGKSVKIKHKLHSPPTVRNNCRGCGDILTDKEKRGLCAVEGMCFECYDDFEDDDPSWDAHKHC